MKTSEQISELAAAMALAQADLVPARLDALNPYYDSKYADNKAVWDVCRKAFPPHGLAIFQDIQSEEHGICVTTRIIHTSGQWVEFGPLFIPVAKEDAHSVGSACTYGRRYSLQAATGIVADSDDDGNAAMPRPDARPESHHTDHIERGAASTTPPPSNGGPPDPNAPPSAPRPAGLFGYGKKFVDTPWNLMSYSQLEWFRDADRTPAAVRDKCRAEIAWRAYESAKAEKITQTMTKGDTEFGDDIPM